MSDKKAKSPNKKSRSTANNLRRVEALLREVDIIQTALDGKKPIDPEKSKLDDFQKQKLELTELLTRIKEDIITKNKIESSLGTNAQSIRIKHTIEKNIEYAKEEYTKLEDQYTSDLQEMDSGLSTLDSEEMKQREELCNLLQQDLNYTQHTFKPKVDARGGGGFQLARKAHEKRRKKREEGLITDEPIPLTGKQQAFIQMSIQRDKVLDEKLEIIKMGVRQLGVIGQDINIELEKHEEMLKQVGDKMNDVQDKIENRNKQLKDLLKKSGGMTRWCPVFILFIILLACLGYIYNSFL